MKSKGKARIKQNAYDNWYGYIGTRRVIAFCNPVPSYGAQHEAWDWLVERKSEGHPVNDNELPPSHQEGQ